MKRNVEVKGEIENAYGKPLHELAVKEGCTPVPKGKTLSYLTTIEEYETAEEVRTANDWIKDEDVVKFRNTQRRANARQKAMQTAMDDAGLIAPTIENDDQLRLKKMFELFLSNIPAAQRDSDEAKAEARQKAAQVLNLTWA